MNFWEHLEELRQTLLRCVLLVFAASLLSFCFYEQVSELLTRPLNGLKEQSGVNGLERRVWQRESLKNVSSQALRVELPETTQGQSGATVVELAPGESIDYERPVNSFKLAIFSPTEGLMVAFKLSAWLGLVLSSPFCLFLLMRFLSPGLLPPERRLIIPFVALSCLFIALGVAFALGVTVPFANRFLYAFNTGMGENLWSLGNYMNFTVLLALANGLAFELVVLLLFLVHLGKVSADTLRDKRRHAVVGIVVLSAVLTPPDVLTQLLLALPLVCLYELTILYARILARRSSPLTYAHVD